MDTVASRTKYHSVMTNMSNGQSVKNECLWLTLLYKYTSSVHFHRLMGGHHTDTLQKLPCPNLSNRLTVKLKEQFIQT